MNNRIPIIIMAVFSMLVLFGIDIQTAYAQTSATITLYQTSNASDDTCTSIVQSASSIVWLGCYSSAITTTLRINVMNGNTTLASTTLASQSQHFNKFFAVDSNNMVLVDISSATADIVRKYNISGSTLTNSASVTLTGCNSDTAGEPMSIGSTLYVLCTSGDIKVVNMDNMTVTGTLTTTIQGGCANSLGIFMVSTSKGLVYCDNTELYSFTVSGSTITFVDSVTGFTSVTLGVGLIQAGVNVWVYDFDTGSSIDVVNIDTSDMTFSSSPITIPAQSNVHSIVANSSWMMSLDSVDDNIMFYDISSPQPDTALGNLGGFDTGLDLSIGISSTLWVASAITDAGRFYKASGISVNGTPFGGSGGGSTGGIDCTLPANANLLICRLVNDVPSDDPITVLPKVGILITTNLDNMSCSLLPIDCDTNPDRTTNGVGYLYSIVAFAIMVSIFWVATNGQLNKIPTFIWMISSIALLGGLVAIEFLDPTFLVIGVIVIVALAAMQIRNSITSGLDFASGDF